jgi:hypothetical protein
MKLKVYDIDLPDGYFHRVQNPFSDERGSSNPARSADGALASFDASTLLIRAFPMHVPYDSGGCVDYEEMIAYLSTGMKLRSSPEYRFWFLIRETSVLHEISHFHDLVCTPVGSLVFLHDWARTYGICTFALRIINERGSPLCSSLLDVAIENVGSDAHLLISACAKFQIEKRIINGDLPILKVDRDFTDFDVVWGIYKSNSASIRVPFVPVNTIIDDVQQCCCLIPIGFRAITECRAILWQQMAIASFGEWYLQRYHRWLRSRSEYVVINVLIKRLFGRYGLDADFGYRRNGGGDHYKILSRALFRHFEVRCGSTPAQLFIEELAHVDETTGSYAYGAEEMREQFRLGYEVAYKKLEMAADSWCGHYVRNNVLGHLRQAAEVYEQNEAPKEVHPGTLEWYTLNQPRLPPPPIVVQGNVLARTVLGEEDAIQHGKAVALFVMERSLIEQAIWRKQLCCPVLVSEHSAFLRIIRVHQFCEQGVLEGGCGRFQIGEDITLHCDCAWKSLALRNGLASNLN